jgi:hypothetical protein
MTLPGQLDFDNVAEVQMLLWRIHSPIQQAKKKRGQTGTREDSG